MDSRFVNMEYIGLFNIDTQHCNNLKMSGDIFLKAEENVVDVIFMVLLPYSILFCISVFHHTPLYGILSYRQ